MEEINIYANGLPYCSVCTTAKLNSEKVEELVNQKNPTGIDSKWKIDKENFRTGEENPHECEDDKNRLHYLLSC